jgi:hypothetical protein
VPYPPDKTKLQKWCSDTRKSVLAHPDEWDCYDMQIRVASAAYTAHLGKTPGYLEPDFFKVKAMIWTETGAGSAAWKEAPMQIGLNGDPGLTDLLNTPPGKLILPQAYQLTLNATNVPINPNLNIAAGIGYLLKRLANFRFVHDPEPATRVPHSTKKKHLHSAARLAIVGWKVFDFHFAASHYNVGDGNYEGKLQCAYNLLQERMKASVK